MKKALPLGIAASFFFAFTFVLNRSMNLSGGHWLWSACLRYFFMLAILLPMLALRHQVRAVLREIRQHPLPWLLWSTVGFGLFYAPLSAASVYAPGWFTAAAWQLTIVAGVLLTPLFGKPVPVKNLLLSGVVLAGIFVMQLPHVSSIGIRPLLTALLLILIAAFSYPLGNRKMMQVCPADFTTLQRVFGMTLCSIPFWLLCAARAGMVAGAPPTGQLVQSFLVAVFSGVVATILFFRATDIVRHDPRQLAVIEATQCGEVIFTLVLGVLVLRDTPPSPLSLLGIALIAAGMVLNSLAAE